MHSYEARSNRSTAWAKSPKRTGAVGPGWLSLVDHSIDVAAVAEALLNLPTVRTRLGALAGRPLSDIDIDRLCFFVGLHDAGKVNHGFQAKLRSEKPYAGHIGPLWSILGRSHFIEAHRMLCRDVRRAMMARRWRLWFEDHDAECEFWAVILAHHGSLSPIDNIAQPEPSLWHPGGGYDPIAALTELAEVVAGMFSDALAGHNHEPLPGQSRFQHAFAGFVTLADWLGSDETVFQFPSEGAPSGADRIQWARNQAQELMSRRWFDPSRARDAAIRLGGNFATLFHDLAKPRPAQTALLEAPLPRAGQVTVLEAETGSGKTEAALIHFLRLFQEGQVDGLYFALPTRAAAVQIHRRINRIVHGWLGEAAPPVGLAVPGYLRVDDTAEGKWLPDEHRVLWPDEDVRDRAWAVENAKRYLSGAVMVGTIDQLLLGGLRVRHAPFRSGPMVRLLLCVDEVHASDAYMTELLRNVLNQHTSARGHALLMSATLGSLARLRLLGGRVEAHQAPDLSAAVSHAYPSLQRSGEDLQPLPRDDRGPREKRVTVELLDPEADQTPLMERLKVAADSGAAVLFIRNRVDDARETFLWLEKISARLLPCGRVTAPHHGRFAPEDRRLLDEALERALDKCAKRDGVVAVTTQTAEQSLDIDADWLVTDIAPGDVLLQRIGRLHRHERVRPMEFEEPRVTVLAPIPEQLAGTLDQRGRVLGRTLLGIGKIYENIVGVLATRAYFEKHKVIRIPANNRAIVEAATHRGGLAKLAEDLGGVWPSHLLDVEGKTMAAAGTAKNVAINWEDPLTENQPIPNERAETRLGLKDRRVELTESLPGPFSKQVRTLHIPGWMAGDEPEDAVVTDATAHNGEIRFCLGSKIFCYDRLGLSIVAE